MIGLASGISGATLGYEKMFANDKHDSKLYNAGNDEYGNTQDILKARYDKAHPVAPAAEPAVTIPVTTPAVPTAEEEEMGPEGKAGFYHPKLKNGGLPKYQPAGPVKDQSGAPFATGDANDGFGFSSNQSDTPFVPHTISAADYQDWYNMRQRQYTQENTQKAQEKQRKEGADIRAGYGNSAYNNPGDFKMWFAQNAQRPDVMANSANRQALEAMWKKETGQDKPQEPDAGPLKEQTGPAATGDASDAFGWTTPDAPKMQKTGEATYRGDNAGFVAGNNAIIGLGYFADWAEQRAQRKSGYNQMMRNVNNTDSMLNAYDPKNPFGNERTNMAVGPNSQLVMGTPMQDFSQVGAKYGGMKKYREGGTYEVSPEEIMAILAAGGEIEYL